MPHLNEQEIITAISNSKSIAEVNEKIGYYRQSTTGYRIVKEIIKKYSIDTSHFTGQRWSKGITILTDSRISHKYSKEDIFCEKSKVSRGHARKIIISEKLIDYKCNRCGISEWNDDVLCLELEHKNGIRDDNRLENLTFLCPNCHSQTSTYKGRNIVKQTIPETKILEVAENSRNITDIILKLNMSGGISYRRIRKILQKNNFIFPHMRYLSEHKSVELLPNPNWRTEPKVNQRKVARPSRDKLIELIKTKSMCQIARDFGLKNDNSIRKWCESYGINYKEISPFSLLFKKENPKPVKIKRIEKSIYKYVCEEKNRGWVARIRDCKTKKYLFVKHTKTEIEAAQAVSQYFGVSELILK